MRLNPVAREKIKYLAAQKIFDCAECGRKGLSVFAVIGWFDKHLCTGCAPKKDLRIVMARRRSVWGNQKA